MKDLKILATFIDIYCQAHHVGQEEVSLRTHDVAAIMGRPVRLCTECRRLMTHAWVKRTHCPLDPKPACKHCPVHCYHPDYRRRIQEVMRFAGRRMVFSGRLDYLFKLLF